MSDKEKDTIGKNAENSLKESNLLEKDNFSFYLFQKVERLTNALYLVTSFITQDSLLRTRLRSSALDVLAYAVQLRGLSASEQGILHGLFSEVGEVLALLRIAACNEYISVMNAEMLVNEYYDFLLDLHDDRGKKALSTYRQIDPAVFVKQFDRKNTNNAHSAESLLYPQVWGRVYDKGFFDTDIGEGHIRKPAHRKLKGSPPRSKGHFERESLIEDRKTKIVDLVRSRGKISVKDVASIITNCSEKTLQRDLVALVNSGVLKKEGERRWSMYLLV